MRNADSKFKRAVGFAFIVVPLLSAVSAENPIVTMSSPSAPVVSGEAASIGLQALNTSTQSVSWLFPEEIRCRLTRQSQSSEIAAILHDRGEPTPASIAPGAFAQRHYDLTVPEGWTGEVIVELPALTTARLVLTVVPPSTNTAAKPSKRGLLFFLRGRKPGEAGRYDPDEFFKEHIFGYEPFYFIAGTRSPNAKFQLSFKYRLLNDRGWLARQAPALTGLHLGYTQTSLWDWNSPSAPFFDTSYKPELLYSWSRLVGGAPTNWFRLDIQGGFQHESNGKAGADSRSINIAYLRPTLVFGKDNGPQLSLIPRAWVYVGDLSDNPDIANYRGYADLRAVVGWKRGLQVSALGRIGKEGHHGSVQTDITYPLMQPPSGSFSIYLHLQYFTGYGESILGYNQKTEAFRAGIALYR